MSRTATQPDLRSAALRYVADRATQYLLQVGEPAKTGQISGFVGEDHPVSAKVVRDALTLDPRFVQKDRRWDLAAREIDARRPLERVIEDLLRGVGRPLSIDTLGVEISKALGSEPETETETVRRLVGRRPRFVVIDTNTVAISDAFLDVSSDDPDDVAFDNFDDTTLTDELAASVKGLDWSDPAAAATKVIGKAAQPVDAKALAFLAYSAQPEGFNPVAFTQALNRAGLTQLSDGSYVTPELVTQFAGVWESIGDEPAVEGAPEEAARPAGQIAVKPSDLEEIGSIVRRTDSFVTSRQILEQVFEVSPSDRDYEQWEAALSTALTEQGDLINVGWDRWRRFETVPTDILDVPATLGFQSYSFQTLEGEELDIELQPDGFEGNLKDQVNAPIARLGGECKRQADGSARCAVTILHHESGTLPVAGDPRFFTDDPLLQEATLTGENGKISLWINNGLDLAFGLKDLYAGLPESGGVFTLRPATRPGEYKLETSGELDSVIGIDEARLKELRAIGARGSFKETSTFDLLQELLDKHRKGAEFFTLLAELWIIRPVTASQVASILSGYYCFKQTKTGTWTFDPREVDKGFKKAKRKYVV